MASQGPNSGGTFANVTGVGSISWTNPSNAASSNNVKATATLNPSQQTNYLQATNFGFSIPSGATIDGIVVEIECSASFFGPKDIVVKLVKGGTISGTNTVNTNYWSDSSDMYLSHGSSSNLWGLSWTDSDINSSSFGVAISAINASVKFSSQATIDHIRITVYYTASSGPITNALLYIGD